MNPTKLVWHFSELSTIFCAIYKNQQNCNTVDVTVFCCGPGSFCRFTTMPLLCTKLPKKSQTLQCRPRAPAGGGPAKFRRTAGRGRPGAGGDWPLGPRGPIPGLGCGGEGPARRVRRRPAASAAATAIPARLRLGGGNGHTGDLGEVQGKVGKGLLWCAADRAWSSPRLPAMAPAAAQPRHGWDEKGGDLFIGDKCACQRPKRSTTTSSSKRRPRQECTAGGRWTVRRSV
jgi:hypothetical protein